MHTPSSPLSSIPSPLSSPLSPDDVPTPSSRPTRPKRRKSTKKEEEIGCDVTDIEDPPSSWPQIYAAIIEQRASGPRAPVDTMGCDSHLHHDARTERFHALISLMISAQCKDTQNAVTMAVLKKELGGLTLESMLDVDESVLRDLIKPCGLHNRKAKYLKSASIMLRDEFGGDIPKTIEEIVRLPGVGPKMGYLLLHSAWGILDGIGVDTHVHRISNLLGWVQTNSPEKTRVALQRFLPREEWKRVNHLMVGLGQTVCLPRGRRCDECLVAKAGCPAVVIPLPKKKRVKVEDSQVEVKLEQVTEDKIKQEVEELEIEQPLLATVVKQEIEELEGHLSR